jgi:hypothetical protein
VASLFDTLQQVLTTVQRLSYVEDRQADEVKEWRDGVRSLRTDLHDIERRLVILETRFDGLSDRLVTEARAAAQSAASLAVAGELRGIAERVVRLEAGCSAGRLPRL